MLCYRSPPGSEAIRNGIEIEMWGLRLGTCAEGKQAEPQRPGLCLTHFFRLTRTRPIFQGLGLNSDPDDDHDNSCDSPHRSRWRLWLNSTHIFSELNRF